MSKVCFQEAKRGTLRLLGPECTAEFYSNSQRSTACLWGWDQLGPVAGQLPLPAGSHPASAPAYVSFEVPLHLHVKVMLSARWQLPFFYPPADMPTQHLHEVSREGWCRQVK